MDSLLSRLARGLGLGRSAAADTDSQSPSVLRRIAGSPPADVIRALSPEIRRSVANEPDFARRLLILDSLRQATEEALPALEADIAASRLPLPVAKMATAVTIDNLLKSLSAEYQAVVTALAAAGGKPAPTPLARATLHAVRLLFRRHWLAALSGKASSRTAWRQFHRLHRLAREAGYAEFGEGDGSIELLYRQALLLSLADPAQLPRADLVPLRAVLEAMAPLLKLSDAREPCERPDDAIYASSRDPMPMAADVTDASLHPAWRVLLDAPINQLQNEIRDADRARETGTLKAPAAHIRLLGRLLERFRGQPIRRFTRQSMRPRVDVVTGIDRLW